VTGGVGRDKIFLPRGGSARLVAARLPNASRPLGTFDEQVNTKCPGNSTVISALPSAGAEVL
jgi:hypothetical protein